MWDIRKAIRDGDIAMVELEPWQLTDARRD